MKHISWPVKLLIFVGALLIGVFDHTFGNWGASVVPASLGFFVPLLLMPSEFWNQERFRIAVSGLALLQVVLIIGIRAYVRRFGLVFMLPFGAVDCIFVIAVLLQVGSQPSTRHPER